MKKKLGIIGGLGPMASALFLQILTAATDAACDQEHVEALLYSRPQTPDRTAFLLGKTQDNPYPVMLDSGRQLEQMGCEIKKLDRIYLPLMAEMAVAPFVIFYIYRAVLL